MALQLAPEEPEAGPWRVERLTTVVNAVTRRRSDQGSSGRPAVLAIDGRSNNGKTTLAARISELVPGSAVICTDDIAWEHSRFGWADLLIDGILVPAHHGQPVSYRPSRWDEHGRAGSLQVPAGCPLLIIEGDGAGRREVAHLIDTVIWVQADEREAGRRAAARAAHRPAADLANRAADGAPFDEDGWMAEEIPFNTAQRTWERADLIVCSTPQIPCDPGTEIVIAPPPLHPGPRRRKRVKRQSPADARASGWPAQCPARPSTKGASHFLRKCPSVTLDRGDPRRALGRPHKCGSQRLPHNNPTDETALCGTRRHDYYHGLVSP